MVCKNIVKVFVVLPIYCTNYFTQFYTQKIAIPTRSLLFVVWWSKKKAQAHLYISVHESTPIVCVYIYIYILFIFPLLSNFTPGPLFLSFILLSLIFFDSLCFTYAWRGSLKLVGLNWPRPTLGHSISFWMSCVHEG